MSDSDIVFDYEGSLQAARTLWALADELKQLRDERVKWAEHALEDWRGLAGQRFRNRSLGRDRNNLNRMVLALEAGARDWAAAFAKAVDEQNLVLYSRETTRVGRVRAERNLLEDAIALIHDDERLPRRPEPCAVPRPPSFHSDRRPRLQF
jgi:hypothetical protein